MPYFSYSRIVLYEFFSFNFFFFCNFQDKESVSETPTLDLPCSIG